MTHPSIKGVALRSVVSRVNRLVWDGKLDAALLADRLGPDDLALLDNELSIEPSFWYPIDCSDRLFCLLRDTLFGGDERELVRWGFDHTGRLLETPSYAALVEGAQRMGERAGVALIKLAQLVYNTPEWNYEGESLRDFRVHAREAGALPRSARLVAAGVMAALASRSLGEGVDVELAEDGPDHAIFRGRARSL